MVPFIYLKSYILCPGRKGQATLSLALLLGGLAILIGVTLAFLTISFINTTAGFQASSRALTVASTGAGDALLQLIRNKSFSSTGYTVTVGSDTATVEIRNSSLVNRKALITSQATVGGAERKIQVTASLDPDTGRVAVISWESVALELPRSTSTGGRITPQPPPPLPPPPLPPQPVF